MYYNPFDELLVSIINAGGFVNAHAHFDRAYTVNRQSMRLSTLSYKRSGSWLMSTKLMQHRKTMNKALLPYWGRRP